MKKIKMKKKMTVIGAILAFILIMLIFIVSKINSVKRTLASVSPNQVSEVKKGDINSLVSGTGNLEMDKAVDVAVPTGVVVKEILVENGDVVQTGQTLAKLDAASVAGELLDAKEKKEGIEEELEDSDLSDLEIEKLEGEKADIEETIQKLKKLHNKPEIIATTSGIIENIYVEEDVEITKNAAGTSSYIDEGTGGTSSGAYAARMSHSANENPAIINLSMINSGRTDMRNASEKIPSSDKDAPSEAPNTNTSQSSTGNSATNPDSNSGNMPGGSSDGNSGNTPGGSSDGNSGNMPGESSDGNSGNTPGGSSDDNSGNMPGGSSDGNSRNTPGGSADSNSGNIPGGSSDDNSGNTPGGSSDGNSGNTPGGSADSNSGNMPGGSSDDNSGNMPGESSDGNSGNTPGGSADSNSGNMPGKSPGNNSGSMSWGSLGSVSGGTGAVSGNAALGNSAEAYNNFETTAFTIQLQDKVKVSVSVDEMDVLDIHEGQKATVTLDALADEEFTGEITKIVSDPVIGNGSTKYTVEISLEKTESMMRGMSASVAIITGSTENAVIIPIDALQETGNKVFVYTKENDNGTLSGEKEVETGISDSTYVEIKEGLKEGDIVYYTRTDDSGTNPFMGMPGGGMGGPGGVGAPSPASQEE